MRTILKNSPLRAIVSAAVLLCAITGLSACDTKTNTNAKGELNIYSARHYDADEQLYAMFEKQSGIRVNRIEMKGDLLLQRLQAEGDQSPADVILLVDAGNFWRAEKAGLFQPVQSSKLNATIPENLRGAGNNWFGFAKRARVIAYNRAEIQPSQVDTYADLTSPELKGKVCMRPSNNVYNLSLMSYFIDKMGVAEAEAWAKGVVANFARPAEGADTDQLKAIADGRCGVSLVNHYYAVRMMRSDDPAEREMATKFALSFPDQNGDGTHVNVSGGAVALHAPNKANALAFLEFLASEPAQEILANANDEFPVVASALKNNPELSALTGFKEAKTPMSALGNNQPEAQKVFDRAGWK